MPSNKASWLTQKLMLVGIIHTYIYYFFLQVIKIKWTVGPYLIGTYNSLRGQTSAWEAKSTWSSHQIHTAQGVAGPGWMFFKKLSGTVYSEPELISPTIQLLCTPGAGLSGGIQGCLMVLWKTNNKKEATELLSVALWITGHQSCLYPNPTALLTL